MYLGGRLENADWFDNSDDDDKLIFDRFNTTANFQPSAHAIQLIVDNKEVVLMSRSYVRKNKRRNELHGFTLDVFSNPVEIICERGKQ